MMEHHASNPYGSPIAIPVSEPEAAQSELSSKVRALQDEIRFLRPMLIMKGARLILLSPLLMVSLPPCRQRIWQLNKNGT